MSERNNLDAAALRAAHEQIDILWEANEATLAALQAATDRADQQQDLLMQQGRMILSQGERLKRLEAQARGQNEQN